MLVYALIAGIAFGALLSRVGDQVAEGAALVGFAASVPAPA
jgi:hypothetical protein